MPSPRRAQVWSTRPPGWSPRSARPPPPACRCRRRCRHRAAHWRWIPSILAVPPSSRAHVCRPPAEAGHPGEPGHHHRRAAAGAVPSPSCPDPFSPSTSGAVTESGTRMAVPGGEAGHAGEPDHRHWRAAVGGGAATELPIAVGAPASCGASSRRAQVWFDPAARRATPVSPATWIGGDCCWWWCGHRADRRRCAPALDGAVGAEPQVLLSPATSWVWWAGCRQSAQSPPTPPRRRRPRPFERCPAPWFAPLIARPQTGEWSGRHTGKSRVSDSSTGRRAVRRRTAWWAWVGSNHRPRDYESPALTTELQARGPAGYENGNDPRDRRGRGAGLRSGGGARTHDNRINSAALCQLSYP